MLFNNLYEYVMLLLMMLLMLMLMAFKQRSSPLSDRLIVRLSHVILNE